jgi:glycine cleavage system H protein
MEFPSQLQYTKDHEWIDASTKGQAVVGVTGYAVEQLGDIVHVDLPSIGESFDVGASFGTIESTKTVSDLYMPVSGKVVEVNKQVLSSPELIQEDPYKEGWLVKIAVETSAEASLLSATEYETFISEQDD